MLLVMEGGGEGLTRGLECEDERMGGRKQCGTLFVSLHGNDLVRNITVMCGNNVCIHENCISFYNCG